MIEFRSIINPRTPEGGWVDNTGCDRCGIVSSGYVEIKIPTLSFVSESFVVRKFCGGCVAEQKKKIDEAYLTF